MHCDLLVRHWSVVYCWHASIKMNGNLKGRKVNPWIGYRHTSTTCGRLDAIWLSTFCSSSFVDKTLAPSCRFECTNKTCLTGSIHRKALLILRVFIYLDLSVCLWIVVYCKHADIKANDNLKGRNDRSLSH